MDGWAQDKEHSSLVLNHPHPGGGGMDGWAQDKEHSTHIDFYYLVPFCLLITTQCNVTKTMWDSWNKLILKEKGIVQNRNKK